VLRCSFQKKELLEEFKKSLLESIRAENLMICEGYPLKKDYTWQPIENLYGHEELPQTYEQWLKTENELRKKTKGTNNTGKQTLDQEVADD